MKNIRCSFFAIAASVMLMFSIASCDYDVFVDAEYPDQLIYMPAAKHNIYKINAVPMAIGSVPTPGYPYRFVTDTVKREFRVLLGVYRSGITNDGGFNVDITVDTDTISQLIAGAKMPANTVVLTSDKYSIVDEVTMSDGDDLAKFDLVVNLDTLRNNMTRQYGIAVKVSSEARESNPLLATTLIQIDAAIMKPAANFTFAADGGNSKLYKFTNTTKNGLRYTWNFGDGSAVMKTSNEVNTAVTHTYVNPGTYTVTLTAIGVTDSKDKSVKTSTITVL